MSQVWVKAKNILRADVNGAVITYYPGDWLTVGRQQAREWLANNQCEILKPAVLQTVQDLTNCSIVLKNGLSEQQSDLINKFPGVPIQLYDGSLPDTGRFLLWDTTANLRQEFVVTGFGLLNTWQMAVPLRDYEVLAQDLGTPEEREVLKAAIGDLRVPVYDTRIIFARKSREVDRLFSLWNGGNELAFLKALYLSAPVINALPPSWIMA